MKTTFIGALICVLSLTACAESNSANDETNSTSDHQVPQVIETQNEIRRVTKAEFKTFLAENETLQLIDVRTPDEFQAGAIETATNMDYNDPNFEKNIQSLSKFIPVLIYCKSGGRSSKALKVFEANGFIQVLELEGGYSNW